MPKQEGPTERTYTYVECDNCSFLETIDEICELISYCRHPTFRGCMNSIFIRRHQLGSACHAPKWCPELHKQRLARRRELYKTHSAMILDNRQIKQ